MVPHHVPHGPNFPRDIGATLSSHQAYPVTTSTLPPGLISAASQTQPLPSSSTWKLDWWLMPRISKEKGQTSFASANCSPQPTLLSHCLLRLIHAIANSTLGDKPWLFGFATTQNNFQFIMPENLYVLLCWLQTRLNRWQDQATLGWPSAPSAFELPRQCPDFRKAKVWPFSSKP